MAVAPSAYEKGPPFWAPVPGPVDPSTRFQGLLPQGGVVAGTAYLALGGDPIRALAGDGSVTSLSGTGSPATLAVSRGTPARLAWGEYKVGTGATLLTSPVSGSPTTTLDVPAVIRSAGDTQVVAARWSNDGSSLYYVREELGLGGYGLFQGVSSLYRYSLARRTSTTIVPFRDSPSPTGGCLDDLSADETRLTDHCVGGQITIRDLRTGTKAFLRLPEALAGHMSGSARFSPDGSLVAFGIGLGSADADEQCWLAVGPSTGGKAKVVWTGRRGDMLGVLGWLDGASVLLQTGAVAGPTTWVQTLRLGDRASTIVASGMFAALG
jgi:hypothetical protein